MNPKNPSDAKPKSKEPFSVASTERLSNVPRSAVRPSDSFKKMEIVNTKKLTEPEWELLMKALDIEKPYKCQFCGKEVKYPEMGLFPPKIIICGSVICVSEALGEVERNGVAPSASLDKIKEKAEKQGDRQLPINTEIVTIIADEWDKMFSEIRELLDREITCKKCFVLDEWHEQAKELALKSKRIAELEAELKKAKA